jgi:hypothetical protein
MAGYTNWDFIYPVFSVLFGIFMIVSPRSLMYKAKYDEEGLKTESWVKKCGIGLCIIGVAYAVYLYYRLYC